MTFPVVQATTRGQHNLSTTSHDVPLPATVNAGDLLVVLYAISNDSAITWDNFNAGTWTQLFDEAAGTSERFVAYYKFADGSEDAATLTITSASSARAVHHVYRISGAVSIEGGSAVDSSSTTTAPNPPSITPSWGDDHTLWLVGIAAAGSLASATPETNYSANGILDQSATSGVAISSSYRTNQATSEDPAAWTLGTARRCLSATFAVEPYVSANPIATPGYDELAFAGFAPTAYIPGSEIGEPEPDTLRLVGYAPSPRILSSPILAAGSLVIRTLIDIHLDSGRYSFWDGDQNKAFDGTTYLAASDFGEVSAISLGKDLGAEGIELRLNGTKLHEADPDGADPGAIFGTIESEPYQLRRVDIRFVFINAETGQLAFMRRRFAGFIDQIRQVEEIGDEGRINCWLIISAESIARRYGVRGGRTRSHDDQQDIHPGDTFFKYTASTIERSGTLYWGRKPPGDIVTGLPYDGYWRPLPKPDVF